MSHDWGIPSAIISDRDAKFLSSFWRTIFKQMGTKLLTSTAYHPQTDGASERTNQTVEVALRYHLTANPNDEWTAVLPFIQATLNNSTNASIGMAPNEALYGFRTRDALSLLCDLPAEDYSRMRQIRREEAEEALAFANVSAKTYYDKKHQPLQLQPGTDVFLRLHKGYTIPGEPNRKLSIQRTGPFRIIRKVGRLAYELDLPPTMKIHPVVSVAHLEPSPGKDPYERRHRSHPPAVQADIAGNEENDTFEIERLVRHRDVTTGRKRYRTYLVHWKGYESHWDRWYKEDALAGAKELMDEYDAKHPRPGGEHM
jgi:hypothetical protein